MEKLREQQDCDGALNTVSPQEKRALSSSVTLTAFLVDFTHSTALLCRGTCGPPPMSLVPTEVASSQEALSALESSLVPCPSESLYHGVSVVNTISTISANPELPFPVGRTSALLVPGDS